MRIYPCLAILLAVAVVGASGADTTPQVANSNAAGTSVSVVGDIQIVPKARLDAVPGGAPLPQANIRVDTNIVLVPVTVTDPLNRTVTGLDRDSFEVYEDKIKQRIVSFGSEDAPLSIGIVFDTSGSMGPKLERSRLFRG